MAVEMSRELGPMESKYIERGVNFTNNFKVTSRIDLNFRQTLVRRVIDKWKQLNPILRCQVKMASPEAEKLKYYFVSGEEGSFKPNMFFLHLRNPSESGDNGSEVSKLLGFKEAYTAFDLTSEQAWRLIFLK